MLKKIILAAVALSFVGAPLAQAQAPHKPAPGHMEPARPSAPGKPKHRVEPHKAGRPGMHRNHFAKGQRFGDWRRHHEVRDYKRYGLRKPARGQRWIKVGDQFLLITTATGVIAGILAAR
ncbi:RcnB family protein [Daeguia caeni]|uniref:RcnB family protein n=1 Tax=Daeguia caeni TaxID=439612 RepID=A0ABV9H9N3_9HYPH